MNQYRTLDKGTLKLGSLFIEHKYNTDTAIYSIGDIDKEFKGTIYPSLYKLYISMADVTEYTFANTYFESYQHWDALCQEEFFKPTLARWRKELELKVKSQALLEIIEQSHAEDPRKRLEAAKYLYEKVYAGDSKGRGRPSKAEIKQEAEKQAKDNHIVVKDYERLLQ